MMASSEELAHNGGGGRDESAMTVDDVCIPTISLEQEHAFIADAVISSGRGMEDDEVSS